MATVTERVVKAQAPDDLYFTGFWAYDDASGDLLAVTWANPTAYPFHVQVRQLARVNDFIVDAGSSSTAQVPQKRYSFIRDGQGDWAPNFTFSVWRA